jgi:uncharacterized DUF497 family protein
MIVISRLIWDTSNIAHIAKHGVSRKEVEQVCLSEYFVLDAKAGRWLVVGTTEAGRTLSIILDPEPEPEVYYVVTARPASPKERKYYKEHKGGEDSDDKAA